MHSLIGPIPKGVLNDKGGKSTSSTRGPRNDSEKQDVPARLFPSSIPGLDRPRLLPLFSGVISGHENKIDIEGGKFLSVEHVTCTTYSPVRISPEKSEQRRAVIQRGPGSWAQGRREAGKRTCSMEGNIGGAPWRQLDGRQHCPHRSRESGIVRRGRRRRAVGTEVGTSPLRIWWRSGIWDVEAKEVVGQVPLGLDKEACCALVAIEAAMCGGWEGESGLAAGSSRQRLLDAKSLIQIRSESLMNMGGLNAFVTTGVGICPAGLWSARGSTCRRVLDRTTTAGKRSNVSQSFRRAPCRCATDPADRVRGDNRPRGVDGEDDDVFVFENEDEEDDVMVLEAPKTVRMFQTPTREVFGGDSAMKSRPWTDAVLLLSLVAVVYIFVTASVSVMSGPYVHLPITMDASQLPWYTALSVTRIFLGYLVSLVFAILYAYCAYRVQFAANALVLIIDILQSIPLLSFLPGVVLGLMSLFPGQRAGVELAAMLLLFTSMAWNMVLGFYQSLLSIPRELLEASAVFKMSAWKRFWMLELPSGAAGLVWNSIMSVAGGWFFLISIESFELGNRDFRLPGIGAFLAAAAEQANYVAVWQGLVALVAVIVATDFVIWRPLIAWSTKFSYGSGPSEASRPQSTVLSLVQRSSLIRALRERLFKPAWAQFLELFPKPTLTTTRTRATSARRRTAPSSLVASMISTLTTIGFLGATGYAGWLAVGVLSSLSVRTWLSLGVDAMYTLGRVVLALFLSMIWTVPLGVAVGRDPKLAARVQPLVQVVASVPATALFPFVLLALSQIGNGLQIGSVALMMLGTMWYVLFNVIAGAQSIPSELFEVDKVYGRGDALKRWRTLILPGIFPYLITGVVTAVGGAWNASIVSEYVIFRGDVISTRGLGALISKSAAVGDYSMLLAGTLVMCVLVLLTNRFIWGPLYRLAETKYKIQAS